MAQRPRGADLRRIFTMEAKDVQLLAAIGFLSASASKKGIAMHKFVIALAVILPLTLLSGAGIAKGCLKGAAVGGVAGHVAGRHAVAGATAGCVIEHHREKVKDKQAVQNAAAAQRAPQPNATPPRN